MRLFLSFLAGILVVPAYLTLMGKEVVPRHRIVATDDVKCMPHSDSAGVASFNNLTGVFDVQCGSSWNTLELTKGDAHKLGVAMIAWGSQ
jgi:hypothetical protein